MCSAESTHMSTLGGPSAVANTSHVLSQLSARESQELYVTQLREGSGNLLLVSLESIHVPCPIDNFAVINHVHWDDYIPTPMSGPRKMSNLGVVLETRNIVIFQV